MSHVPTRRPMVIFRLFSGLFVFVNKGVST